MDPWIFPFLAMPILVVVGSPRKFELRTLARFAISTAIVAVTLWPMPRWVLPTLGMASLGLLALDALTMGFLVRTLRTVDSSTEMAEYRRVTDRAYEARLLALLLDAAIVFSSLAAARP